MHSGLKLQKLWHNTKLTYIPSIEIEDFKTRGSYKFKRVENNAFQSISVDEVIANIFEKEETQVGIEEVEEEVLFFIDDDSDEDDSDADGTDVIEI